MQTADLAVIGLSGQSIFLKVDHFHQHGETVHAQSLYHEPGGKGYNQAVAAARLGARVAYLTAVGQDADGAECLECLENEGIAAFMAQKQAHTAYAAILTDATGETRVTVYPGASALLTAQDVRGLFGQTIASARMLLLQHEIPEEAFAEAFSIAEKHHVPVALNPAPYAAWAEPYLHRADLITPNYSEARQILGIDPAEEISPEQLALRLREAGFSRAVITLGSRGALVLDGEKDILLDAVRVQAADTTGAGDCFHAALCVRLNEGASLEEAARFAVRASALSVTREHVITAMPYRREL